MLIGCGCQCATNSESLSLSSVPGSSWSGSFPSQPSWPESVPPSEPYQPTPCQACVAGVRATAYKVILGKPAMVQQPPTIYGDWGCVEMLQTPFKVVAGELQGPYGITILYPGNNTSWSCTYGVNRYDPGPPLGLGDPIDCSRIQPGMFHANHDQNRRPCAPEPACDLRFVRLPDTPLGEEQYQVRLLLQFNGTGYCSPTYTEPAPIQVALSVEYRTAIAVSKFACLSQISLQWYRGFGAAVRTDPDFPGGRPENYGIGPGNNISYEYHRGTFPQTIFVRPWN